MANLSKQLRSRSGAKKHVALLLVPALTSVVSLVLSQSSVAASDQQNAIEQASWFDNVQVSFAGDTVNIASDGLPNWMEEKYAKPKAGIVVPKSEKDVTLDLASNLVTAQNLNFALSLTPTKAATKTSTSLGPIGILVNGAVIFNPYEGDGKTVAITGNVFITDSQGMKWGFLDDCNGHPGMGGMYHYHGMPPCVTSIIDDTNGPSHILGIAFDGFLIYGDRDMKGKVISSTKLDECNGITSATPEFPNGIYHYVLTEEKSNRSTISCLVGTPANTKPGGGQQGGMGQMPGMGGPQQGGPQQGGPQQGPAQPSPTPSYTTLYKAVKVTQLVCQNGKVKKSVTSRTCPAGFKKISSKKVTKYVETKVAVTN